MADKKITALTDLGDSLAAADLFHVVDDPAGTPINKKITAADVFNNMPSWLGFGQTSQSLTSDGSTALTIDVTSAVTEVNGTSGTATCSLADGADGQVKIILDTATSGTYAQTITPTNLRGYTSVLLNAEGESVILIFKNSNWNIIGGNGYATA
jgi:hypothetical protein